MITIGIIASWFLISSVAYLIINELFDGLAADNRGFSTFLVLLSQGIGALITWGFNALQ